MFDCLAMPQTEIQWKTKQSRLRKLVSFAHCTGPGTKREKGAGVTPQGVTARIGSASLNIVLTAREMRIKKQFANRGTQDPAGTHTCYHPTSTVVISRGTKSPRSLRQQRVRQSPRC